MTWMLIEFATWAIVTITGYATREECVAHELLSKPEIEAMCIYEPDGSGIKAYDIFLQIKRSKV